VIKGHFVGYPEHWDCKPPGPDGIVWTVQNPGGRFGFQVQGGPLIVISDGFKTDGASIPRIAWRVVGPPMGHGPKANYAPAAALHDFLYVNTPFSRKACDQLMLAAMADLKVSWWRRRMMYRVLRVFGGKYYGRKETDFPG